MVVQSTKITFQTNREGIYIYGSSKYTDLTVFAWKKLH